MGRGMFPPSRHREAQAESDSRSTCRWEPLLEIQGQEERGKRLKKKTGGEENWQTAVQGCGMGVKRSNNAFRRKRRMCDGELGVWRTGFGKMQ